MKILQINASYKPAYVYGGPTMSVSKLAEQLVQTGIKLVVFTTTANGAAELDVPLGRKVMIDGVPVIYFKRITKDHTHFSPDLLIYLWREVKNFDAVHIHAWWNVVSVLSCWIAIKRRVPVVVSPRGTLSAYAFNNKNSLPKRVIHSWVGKKLLKKSFIHVTSDKEKLTIENIVTPKGIITIPNFVVMSEEIMDENHGYSKDAQLKLLFFSRIEEKKGLDILLNALTRVKVPYHLTIAGDGEENYVGRLKKIAENNGIADHVSWIGFQGTIKFEVLQQHDLMILPSHDENFGNVIIESLSVGTPVLVSKFVGLADYVTTNSLGWVCELDENDISAHINRITEEKGKLAGIRQTAPGLIRKDFNEDLLTEKYIRMYKLITKDG